MNRLLLKNTFSQYCFILILFFSPFLLKAQNPNVLDCTNVILAGTAAVCPDQGVINIDIAGIQGGTPPYQFGVVFVPGGPSWTSPMSSSPTITSVPGSNSAYTVKIIDANGKSCTKTVIVADQYDELDNITISPIGCDQKVAFTGGKAPFTYNLYYSNPNATPIPPPAMTATGSDQDHIFTGVSLGQAFWIRVIDACNLHITSAAGLLAISPITINSLVPNTSNNTLQVSIGNFNPLATYTYKLYIGNKLVETKVAMASTVTFDNVFPYCNNINKVEVTSDVCSAGTKTFTFPFVPLTINPECVKFGVGADGTATITSTGGFPSKIFECYDNANNLLATSTTGIFTGLSGTSFFFKVKDSCTNVVQTPLIFKPVVNLNSVNADCISGKVNISGTMTAYGTSAFLPITATCSCSPTKALSVSGNTFSSSDLQTNFVVEIKDKCDNIEKIKDTIKFQAYPIANECKKVGVTDPNYFIKYANSLTYLNNGQPFPFTGVGTYMYILYSPSGVALDTINSSSEKFINLAYNTEYKIKLFTSCGLITEQTIKLIPPSNSNPVPSISYSCTGSSTGGASTILPSVSNSNLALPASLTKIPEQVSYDFNVPIPFGTYQLDDCTGTTTFTITPGNPSIPQPETINWNKSYTCTNNTFKYTLYAYAGSFAKGPFILKNSAGIQIGLPAMVFYDLAPGIYTLSDPSGVCATPTIVDLPEPSKPNITYTLSTPFCVSGLFTWNLTNANTTYGDISLIKTSGAPQTFSNGSSFTNLTAGTYILNGNCAEPNTFTLTDPAVTTVPFTLSLSCVPNIGLVYKVVANDQYQPFSLEGFGGIPTNGYTFENVPPGTYTLKGLCSQPTTVVLPAMPTMPTISYSSLVTCLSGVTITAKTPSITKIWQDWLVVNPTVALNFSYTNACNSGAEFKLKDQLGNYYVPNESLCLNDSFIVKYIGLQSTTYSSYTLTLHSSCTTKDEVIISTLPYVKPILSTQSNVVCDGTTVGKLKFKIKSNTKGVCKLYEIKCVSGTGPSTPEYKGETTTDSIVLENVSLGPHCYAIVDPCGENHSTSGTIYKLGEITPDYSEECGKVRLSIDKFPECTYAWYDMNDPNTIVSTGLSYQTDISASPKTYKVVVKSALAGCEITRIKILNSSDGAIPKIKIKDKNIYTACFGKAVILNTEITNDGVDTIRIWRDENGVQIATGNTYNATKSGWYFVTAVNKHKCYTVDSIKIFIPTAELLLKTTQKDISCYQVNNGDISVEAEGGVAPYNYLWNNGKTITKLTDLTPGDYTVTLTDYIKCTVIKTFKILEPRPLKVVQLQKNANYCSAFINFTLSGGSKPFQVSIDNILTSSTNDTFNFCLNTGTHSIKIVDKNGCDTTFAYTFNKKEWILKEKKVNICFGTTYFVNEPNFTKGKIYDKTGTYYDTLSTADQFNCGTCETVFKTDLTVLEQVKVVAEADDYLLCPKATTTAKIVSTTGGLGAPYTYLWTVNNGSTGNVVYDVPKGDWIVTAYDTMGCNGSYQIKIDTSKTVFSYSPSVSEINCKGDKGAINILAQGGVPPYDYKWSNASTASGIYNLDPGTYAYTITDSNQCTWSKQYILEDYVPTPYSTNKANLAVCGNNKTTLSIFPPGGTYAQPFTFTLKDDKGGAIFLNDFDKNKGIWAEIGKGKYILTFTNKYKCIVYDTIIVKSLSSGAKIIQKDSLCEGNKVLLSSSMANTVGITYSWFDGTNTTSPKDWKPIGTPNAALEVSKTSIIYLVQINKNGCNDSIKHTIKAFENPKIDLKGGVLCSSKIQLDVKLSNNPQNDSIAYFWNPTNKNVPIIEVSKIGTYAVTVVNTVTGCKSNTFAEVQNANNWTPDIKESKKLCQGKSITLKADVANGVQITWYKNDVEMPAWKNLLEITISDAGNYKIKVIDGACSGESKDFKVEVFPNPDVSIAQDLKVCFEKKITIIAETTTKGLLDFLWSNTDKTKEIVVEKGSYSVTVTDENTCTATANTNLGEYEILKAEIIKPKKMCPNESITLSLIAAYDKYEWSDGSKSATFTTNKSGSYSVTVANDKGCTAVANVMIEDAVTVVPILETKPVCYNAKGVVGLTNANDFDKKIWSNGTTNSSIAFEKEEKVSVKTVDKNGCLSEAEISTAMFPKPKVTPIVPTICEGLNGNIALKEPFEKYLWSDASTNSTLPVNTTGTYYVTVTDINGCTVETFAALQIKENPKNTIAGASKVCIGDSIFVELSDTKNIKKYTWSDNLSTTSQAVYPNVGTYTVTYTDNNGCIGTATKTVETADGLEVKIDFLKKCKGDTVVLNPGKFGKYVWSNGSFLQEIKVTQAGTYIVTVSNKNCTGVAKVDASFFDLPTPIITTKEKPCFGKKTTLNLNYDKNIWSSGEINQLSVEKPKGDYTVTVTNSDGCTAKTAITVTELDKLIPETVSGEGCEGTTITIGLKNNYPKITWDSLQNTQFITVTKGGTYTVKVVDANGCEGENFAKAIFNPLPEVKATAEKTPVCPSQQTTIIAQSTSAVKYDWSNNTQIDTKSQIVGVGIYTVTVTDAKGCKASDKIVITELKPIAISLEVKNLKLCAKDESAISLFFNGLDGKKATVTLADGSSFLVIKNITKDTIFTYKPDNDKTLSIQTVSIEGYDCAIDFDKNKKFEVKVSKLYATLNAKSQKCFGVKNGSLNLNTNSSNITWNITSFANNKIFNNLGAGYFAVTVSDDLGCFLSTNATLIKPKPIEVSVISQKVCKDAKDGSFEIKANGGTGALKYYVQGKSYDDGKMTNLSEGIYTIMVKDSEGCTSQTDKVTIENYPVLSLILDAGDTSSIVEGYDSLRIKATITIDGRIVKNVLDEKFRVFEWTPYDCPNCLSIFARTDSSTTYQLRITDQYGCKANDKIRIGVDKLVKEVDYPNAVTDGNPFKILNPERSVRKFNMLRIFDRWGNMVYQELNFNPKNQIGWDGSFRGVDCDPGVYVWIADVEFLDGSNKILNGDITVVR